MRQNKIENRFGKIRDVERTVAVKKLMLVSLLNFRIRGTTLTYDELLIALENIIDKVSTVQTSKQKKFDTRAPMEIGVAKKDDHDRSREESANSFAGRVAAVPRHVTEEHRGPALTASPKAGRALSRSAVCTLSHCLPSTTRTVCTWPALTVIAVSPAVGADTRLAPTHSFWALSITTSPLWAAGYLYPRMSWRRKPSANLDSSQEAAATSSSAAQAHLLRSPTHAPYRGPPPKGATRFAQLCPAALHGARCGSWHSPDPHAMRSEDVSSSPLHLTSKPLLSLMQVAKNVHGRRLCTARNRPQLSVIWHFCTPVTVVTFGRTSSCAPFINCKWASGRGSAGGRWRSDPRSVRMGVALHAKVPPWASSVAGRPPSLVTSLVAPLIGIVERWGRTLRISLFRRHCSKSPRLPGWSSLTHHRSSCVRRAWCCPLTAN